MKKLRVLQEDVKGYKRMSWKDWGKDCAEKGIEGQWRVLEYCKDCKWIEEDKLEGLREDKTVKGWRKDRRGRVGRIEERKGTFRVLSKYRRDRRGLVSGIGGRNNPLQDSAGMRRRQKADGQNGPKKRRKQKRSWIWKNDKQRRKRGKEGIIGKEE